MALLSKFSASARTSLIYITLGALILVWTGVRLAFLLKYPPEHDATWYWTWGFLGTGFVFLVIGFALGRIGRAARHAELPPEEVTRAEAQIQQTAAARAPIVAPNAPVVSTATPNHPAAGVMPAVPAAPTATPVGPAYSGQAPLPR